MTAFLLRVLVLATLCVSATAVRADDLDTRTAKRHFERGEQLFALGRFDAALDEYQKAFDAKPIPDFLFNIGQCYRNLGDYTQAIFSFKKYLKLEPDAPDREKVEKLIEELDDKQQRDRGQKLIQPTPPMQSPSHADAHTPIYKQWWFWAGIAVASVAGGVGIYEGTKGGPPNTDLGNIVFGK